MLLIFDCRKCGERTSTLSIEADNHDDGFTWQVVCEFCETVQEATFPEETTT